ncbi:DUF3422 family protein [Methylovirgula sp. 4M-Z18]|uniref:DUF3422 family protein n=1 Tax=Methylovirgula sp. 4M-Z18 TaxID=2293567 RepID=UPI00247AD487|nr:DUF3422 family protein [Methylovirgula sp. 4M-Z18]
MLHGYEHPLRKELHNELHARPSLYFDGDTDVWHVALVDENGAPWRTVRHVRRSIIRHIDDHA